MLRPASHSLYPVRLAPKKAVYSSERDPSPSRDDKWRGGGGRSDVPSRRSDYPGTRRLPSIRRSEPYPHASSRHSRSPRRDASPQRRESTWHPGYSADRETVERANRKPSAEWRGARNGRSPQPFVGGSSGRTRSAERRRSRSRRSRSPAYARGRSPGRLRGRSPVPRARTPERRTRSPGAPRSPEYRKKWARSRSPPTRRADGGSGRGIPWRAGRGGHWWKGQKSGGRLEDDQKKQRGGGDLSDSAGAGEVEEVEFDAFPPASKAQVEKWTEELVRADRELLLSFLDAGFSKSAWASTLKVQWKLLAKHDKGDWNPRSNRNSDATLRKYCAAVVRLCSGESWVQWRLEEALAESQADQHSKSKN